MSALFYEIVAEAPLAINERKPGGSQYQEGLDYVPGRLVRGALATEVVRTCQDPTQEHQHAHCPQPSLCQAVFGESVRFRDARPAGPAPSWPRLLPATAVSCKDNAGFRWNKHGVFDTLIDRACWELLHPPVMQYAPRCPVCGGRTKGYGGAYSVGDRYVSRSVSRELLTRVAINRRRGVAEDELLYAINALSQFASDPPPPNDPYRQREHYHSRFVGSIQVDNADAKQSLEAALERLQRLGGGSSRGLGRVQARVIEAPADAPVAERLAQFNDKLAARWKILSGWRGQEAAPDRSYIAVTLQSDAVLSADGWLPGVRLSEDSMWQACGETGQLPADLRLVRCYTTPVTRGGFQAAWGLPKETDLAVLAGAVFLYEVGNLDGWAERLQRLEDTGVGRRCAEGFGQVRVCDPFHYEAVEEAK